MLAITEVLIRRIMGHEMRPAIMFLNVAVMHKVYPQGWIACVYTLFSLHNECVLGGLQDGGEGLKAHCNMYGSCYMMGETRVPVLSRYGVPMVSQKTALWQNFSCPPPKPVWPCVKSCRYSATSDSGGSACTLSSPLTSLSRPLRAQQPPRLAGPRGTGQDPRRLLVRRIRRALSLHAHPPTGPRCCCRRRRRFAGGHFHQRDPPGAVSGVAVGRFGYQHVPRAHAVHQRTGAPKGAAIRTARTIHPLTTDAL